MLVLGTLLNTLAASSPPAVLEPSNSSTEGAPMEPPTLDDLALLVRTLQKEKAESAARIAALEERVSAMQRRASLLTTSKGHNVALLSARAGASGGMSSAVALNEGEPAVRLKGSSRGGCAKCTHSEQACTHPCISPLWQANTPAIPPSNAFATNFARQHSNLARRSARSQ